MAAIPPKLETEVLAKAGEGWSSRRIADWLSTDHDVKTSHATVGAMLKRLQAERAVVAKAVLRSKLSGSLTTDLDRLEKHARSLDEIADKTTEAIREGVLFARNGGGGEDGPIYMDGVESLAKTVEQLRKITETKLKYSGAEQPDPATTPRPVVMIPAETDE